MAPTTIREAIDWIGACPGPGPHQELMTRILTENAREFDNGRFQFTVSLFMQLNVMSDDGVHGSRMPDQEEHKWFTLGPHTDGVVLRLGDGTAILNETISAEKGAADLIRKGIGHVTGLS